MTKNEILSLLRKLSTVYPNAIKPDIGIVDAWRLVLNNYSAEMVDAALAEYFTKSSYPPKPMEIADICRRFEVELKYPMWNWKGVDCENLDKDGLPTIIYDYSYITNSQGYCSQARKFLCNERQKRRREGRYAIG